MSFWLEIVALIFLISAGTCIRGDTTCNADYLIEVCFKDAMDAGTIPLNGVGVNYKALMANLLLGHGCSIPSCNDFAQGLSDGSECMANGQKGDGNDYYNVPQTVIGKAIQTQCQVLPPDYTYTSRNCTAEETTVLGNIGSGPGYDCVLSIEALTGNSLACNKCKFVIEKHANTNNCDYFDAINLNLVGKLSQSVCEFTTPITQLCTAEQEQQYDVDVDALKSQSFVSEIVAECEKCTNGLEAAGSSHEYVNWSEQSEEKKQIYCGLNSCKTCATDMLTFYEKVKLLQPDCDSEAYHYTYAILINALNDVMSTCEWEETTGSDSTPGPTPSDSTPAPTPSDSTPAPTPSDSTPAPTPSDSTPAPTPSSTDDTSVTGDASKSMALSMVAIFGIFGLAFLN